MRKKHIHYFASFLLLTGVVLAAANSSSEPLFSNLDQFVLVAEDTVHLSDDTQVSSGDVASNNKINISSGNIVNGNLFAPRIHIASGTIINGNATFDRLTKDDTAEILGSTSTPIEEPVVELPEIEDFETGTTTVVVEGEETLNPGNFDIIEVREDAKLTITPGEYNLNKLQLRDSSILIYTGTSTINVKQEFRVNKDVLIAPESFELSPTSLALNFKPRTPDGGNVPTAQAQGPPGSGPPSTSPSQNSKGNQSGNTPANNSGSQSTSSDENDDQVTQNQNRGVSKVITISDDSFITMKILAPESRVNLGDEVTFRGQVLTKDVQVGEGGVFSRGGVAHKAPRPEEIIRTPAGEELVSGEVMVNFEDNVSLSEVRDALGSVDGRITGSVPSINFYQVEVEADTVQELDNIDNSLESSFSGIIERVTKNNIMQIPIVR